MGIIERVEETRCHVHTEDTELMKNASIYYISRGRGRKWTNRVMANDNILCDMTMECTEKRLWATIYTQQLQCCYRHITCMYNNVKRAK